MAQAAVPATEQNSTRKALKPAEKDFLYNATNTPVDIIPADTRATKTNISNAVMAAPTMMHPTIKHPRTTMNGTSNPSSAGLGV